jgi:hypothetical protein
MINVPEGVGQDEDAKLDGWACVACIFRVGRGTGPISWVQFVMATGAKNEPRGFTVVSEAALG